MYIPIDKKALIEKMENVKNSAETQDMTRHVKIHQQEITEGEYHYLDNIGKMDEDTLTEEDMKIKEIISDTKSSMLFLSSEVPYHLNCVLSEQMIYNIFKNLDEYNSIIMDINCDILDNMVYAIDSLALEESSVYYAFKYGEDVFGVGVLINVIRGDETIVPIEIYKKYESEIDEHYDNRMETAQLTENIMKNVERLF